MSNPGTPRPAAAAGGTDIPKSEVFEMLGNERRRYVLQYLRRYGGPVDLGELASRVASWEYRTPVENITGTQRKRVYTTLQQTHLPKLAESNIVAYDAEANRVDTTPQTEELTVYLEVVPDREFPWREYYLSLGAMGVAIGVILHVGVYPFTLVDPVLWMLLFAVVLTASAAYQTFFDARLTLADHDPLAD